MKKYFLPDFFYYNILFTYCVKKKGDYSPFFYLPFFTILTLSLSTFKM